MHITETLHYFNTNVIYKIVLPLSYIVQSFAILATFLPFFVPSYPSFVTSSLPSFLPSLFLPFFNIKMPLLRDCLRYWHVWNYVLRTRNHYESSHSVFSGLNAQWMQHSLNWLKVFAAYRHTINASFPRKAILCPGTFKESCVSTRGHTAG